MMPRGAPGVCDTACYDVHFCRNLIFADVAPVEPYTHVGDVRMFRFRTEVYRGAGTDAAQQAEGKVSVSCSSSFILLFIFFFTEVSPFLCWWLPLPVFRLFPVFPESLSSLFLWYAVWFSWHWQHVCHVW